MFGGFSLHEMRLLFGFVLDIMYTLEAGESLIVTLKKEKVFFCKLQYRNKKLLSAARG